MAWAEKTEEERAEKVGWLETVEQNMEGWTVHVDPSLLPDGKHAEEGKRALKMLANHLQRIEILLPEEPLKKVRKMEIWMEQGHPELVPMQYHPSAEWLKDKGYDPGLAKKVHVTRAAQLYSRDQMLKHPAVILHELAHAYHDQVLGFEDKDVLAAYENAMEKKLLDKVKIYNGKEAPHYAGTNHKEYFAEATEAYLYRNDFYPFVAAELHEYDPQGFALMKKIWGEAAVKE